jgi:hypothetical protein
VVDVDHPISMLATKIRPEVEAAIREEVERALPGLVAECNIRPGHDHDGDEAIYVDVRQHLSNTPFDSEISLELSYQVNNRLFALDEPRFAYVRLHFADKQKIKGW